MLKFAGKKLVRLANGQARAIIQRGLVFDGRTAIEIHPHVQKSLREKRPVVALESTIITHGMPYPENMNTTEEVEELVRMNGATPATIAVIDGRIKVGLSQSDLLKLATAGASLKATENEVVKCSRRDLPYLVACGRTGGTTVASTMLIAHFAGIQIFATGGVGGVHRDGHITMDISADLVELGRTPVTVVCSGVKSILDVDRTLEYLETQGVCVTTYRTASRRFPDFYTRGGNCFAPYNLPGPKEAARLIKTVDRLQLKSGILIAVPIPAEYAANKAVIDAAIKQALREAAEREVRGKNVTPFLLEAITKITDGKSLQANIALIKNNATVAAQIACELAAMLPAPVAAEVQSSDAVAPPLVIGASILDLCMTMTDELPTVLNGATYKAHSKQSAGGVGRNIAEGLLKLFGKVRLISAVGADGLGVSLQEMMPEPLRQHLIVDEDHSTSLCSLLIDRRGDCKLVLGNMDIHERITSEHVLTHQHLLRHAPLIIIDGNLSLSTIECVLHLAAQHRQPVLFEPTDMRIAARPFASLPRSLTQQIQIITPNFYELASIAETLAGSTPTTIGQLSSDESTAKVVNKTIRLLASVQKHFNCVLVTLGAHGVVLMLRGALDDDTPLFPLATQNVVVTQKNQRGRIFLKRHSIRFYRAPRVEGIVNVSGAGDSFTSGFIAGALRGYVADKCVAMGFLAAERALKSESAVPASYFPSGDEEIKLLQAALLSIKKEDHEMP